MDGQSWRTYVIPNPILIIGGSGTLACNLIPLLLNDCNVSRIRCLSRGEHRQKEAAEIVKSDRCDFILGNVQDLERVHRAMRGCESVFHFAAMKSIERAEYDWEEAIATNIQGTKNVIEACREEGIKRAIFTSTDKAVAPVNLYGATKLVAEKSFIQGNVGNHQCRFSCLRYGNVLASQGSVIETWTKAQTEGRKIQITDPDMTRFFWSPKDAAKFCYERWKEMRGGEIFLPKMKAITMFALMKDLFPNSELEVVGKRPGEKMHETLVSKDEREYVTDCGEYWVRWPSHALFPFSKIGKPIPIGEESYCSDKAFILTEQEIRGMICTSSAT